MERALYVLISCANSGLAEQVKLNLSIDKAVLVEDVDEEWHSLYLALEYIAMPQRIYPVEENDLLVQWDLGGEDSGIYLKPLSEASLCVVGSIEAYEDGGYCFLPGSETGFRPSRNSDCGEDEVFFDPQGVLDLIKRHRGV
jgi:hypothetical protein